MSFRCEICKRAMPRRTKMIKIVVKKRPKEYTDSEGRQLKSGWEIEKEKSVCSKCAENFDKASKKELTLGNEGFNKMKNLIDTPPMPGNRLKTAARS